MAIIQNLKAFVQSYPAGLDSVTDLQLSQNENGRQIRFTIGGVTIPAGSVATISGTKPDGVVYSNTGTIEGADTVIFDEDVQMTAVFGTWYAKIRITNAGNTIASARVRFIIDKDPVDAGAIPSESQLDGLVAEAEEYAEAAGDAAERAAITYGSPLTASTAAAMTDVNRVYVYTGSESGYTYGNWYYYNGSAWVNGGVYNSAAVETDTTLTESGVPADAKATGDVVDALRDDLDGFTYVDKSRNIWNETTRNGYYNTSGVFVSNASYIASYFIPVLPDEDYYWCASGNRGRLSFYTSDSESDFISSTSGINAEYFTTPENCKYITFDMAGGYGNTYQHDICINVSDSQNGTYSPYFNPVRYVNKENVQGYEPIEAYYRNHAKTVYSTNRFNPDDVEIGNLSSGQIIKTNAGWRTSGFIYVHDIQTLYFSTDYEGGNRGSRAFYFVTTYTEDKTYISQVVPTSANSPYTIPSGAYWIRFSWEYDATMYDIMVETNKALFSSEFRPYTEQTVIDKYSGYKWAVVGDSLTEGNGRTTMNYHDFIKESLGLTVLNYGVSGTGYKRTEDETKAFYQRISGIDTSADVVTIFGSGNDMQYVASDLGDVTDSGTTTLCGCINTTIDNLYTIMPTVQLGIITPCPWNGYNPNDDTNAMAKYSAKIVEICRLRGIPCLDLYHCSNLRPWDATFRSLAYVYDSTDGVHPSKLGHQIIASRIEEFIKSLLV